MRKLNTANVCMQDVVLNIDIAPTFIELATNQSVPVPMDGQSFKSLLLRSDKSQWRTEFLVEHSGEVQQEIPACPGLSHQRVAVS